jgi:hypothetical protein
MDTVNGGNMLSLVIGLSIAWSQEGIIITEETSPEMNQYEIKPGDTLWDLAQDSFGDSTYWPQLWSINEYITNPHWIYPGNVIQFTPGTAIEPPQIDIISGRETGYVVEAQQFAPVEGLCGPDLRFNFRQPTGTFSVPGFIEDDDNIEILGKVEASPHNQSFVVEKDRVYMKLVDPEIYDCGDIVTIVRKIKKNVRHPNAFFKRYGSLYEVVGEIRILHTYGNYVVGEVRSSLKEIHRKDLVIPSRPTTVQLEVDVPKGDLQGVVIERLAQGHSFSIERDTIFIDRGFSDGVMVGDSFYIVSQQDPYISHKENYELPPTVIGRVVVVDVKEDSAVTVLTDVHNIIGHEGENETVGVTQNPY